MLKSGLFIAAALASLSLGACTPSDAKKSPQVQAPAVQAAAPTVAPSTLAEAAASEARMGPIPGTYMERDEPINHPTLSSCIVVMRMRAYAIRQGQVQGDAAALDAASADYKARLIAILGDENGAEQMIASTAPFFDELTPEQLTGSVALCQAAKDAMTPDDV